jgi:hypothetical protein
MTFQRIQRAGLLVLAALQLVVAGWQYFLPRSFYDDFPTVDLDPPYNEHLMTDVGGLGLALTAMMVFAAVVVRNNLVVATTMLGYLVYVATHFTFHATHTENLSVTEAIGVNSGIGLEVVLAVLLLYVSWLRHRTETARPEAADARN